MFFQEAEPIWLKGKEREKNITIKLNSSFEKQEGKYQLMITASNLYRVYVNGEFLGYGPARAAHGYARVDCWEIPETLLKEENVLAIEAVNYYINSFYLLKRPGFIQAELLLDGVPIRRTDENADFKVAMLQERRTKVQRYSFQRTFAEAYCLEPGFNDWHHQGCEHGEEIQRVEGAKLLGRNVLYPNFELTEVTDLICRGKGTFGHTEQPLWLDRAFVKIGETLHGFTLGELEYNMSAQIDGYKKTELYPVKEKIYEEVLEEGDFFITDLGINLTGFMGVLLECEEDAQVLFSFDEILIDHDIQYNRLECLNVVSLEMKPGKYHFESIEPYTYKYLKCTVAKGKVKIHNLYMRQYINSTHIAQFQCSDEAINRVFEAAKATFVQNVLDIHMDCPSRERAGWLCDSFFTSRAEQALTGDNLVENNFLENYVLPDSFEYLPDGMVPMCYPADHYSGIYIPNWALWLVIEAYEYHQRSPHSKLMPALRNKIDGILKFMTQFENEDGLLENMPSWVFVEWSKANALVDGVNYPTNMMYSAALLAAAELYGVEEWRKKAYAVRKAILEQSYDGRWFHDHSVRKDGKLVLQKEVTEVCQYYAFFCKVADDVTHKQLFQCLINEFGPDRQEQKRYPEVYPANVLVGSYLRFELLTQAGRVSQILSEVIGYFDYMALKTGTLWEHNATVASCNHGFTADIAHVLIRDILGLKEITDHCITVCIPDISLEACAATIPLKDGDIHIEWMRETHKAKVLAPKGYQVYIEWKKEVV